MLLLGLTRGILEQRAGLAIVDASAFLDRVSNRALWEAIVARTARDGYQVTATRQSVAIVRAMINAHNPKAPERAVWLCSHVLLPAGMITEAKELLRAIKFKRQVAWDREGHTRAMCMLSDISPQDFSD